MSSEQFVVTPGGSAVDAHNPWPGLAAFTEDLAAYFCGRSEETEDLFRGVKRKLLTTLFSISGLGKTSLLQAGLFPRLRREGYWPVAIRLDYQPEAPAFSDQVKAALTKALADADLARAVSPDNGETLWEFLHRRDLEWKNTVGNILIPVLVFDQFEEIFTLGNAPAVRAKRMPFLQELADLIENRPPASLEGKLEEEPERIETILFAKQDYRILLSLREDYLPQLEGLKRLAPSIMENRQRLRQMTGTQALVVLLKPGAGLVSPAVARQIVGFVAKAGGTGKTLAVDELAELEVPPPILSLFARQLNDRRRQRALPEITSALLSESAQGILEGFYEECLADQPPGVRAFVEEDLLTESGFRENMVLEQARKKLQHRGGAATALDELVQRRLLQVEERFGVQRIELTHDVLTEAIAKSRTERRQNETLAAAAEREAALRESLRRQRRRMLSGTLAAVAVFAMISILAAYGWAQQREAVRQRDQAVSQKNLALEAITKLTYDLPDRLEKVPGALTTLRDVYEDNLKLLDRMLELAGDSPEAMREKSVNYNRMGNTWVRLGDSAKAREAYDKDRSIIERLAADEPGNRQWQDDLAVSHGNIGVILAAQGNQAQALEEYRKALNIRQRLATQDPDNAKWQQKLAYAHSNVGVQLMTQGDLAAARKEQTAALDIAQRLAAKDPDNTDRQDVLASTHTQLAQVALVQGDATAGIREQRAALEIFERLAAKEPGDTHWQAKLAIGHFSLGNLLTMHGDPENGAKESGMAVEFYERLAAQDPDNAEWQKGLAISHFVSGNALIDKDATRGISEFRLALGLYERLVAKDPTNAELQNYIAAGHMRIGTGLFAQKQFPEALAEARAGLAAAEPMGVQDPKNIIMVQNPLAMAHLLIGTILKEQGDHGQAMKELMTSLEIFRRLADQDPSNAMFQFQVANGGLLAGALLAQKKYDEACRAYGNARDVLEPLVLKFPDNLFYKDELPNIYGSMAWALLLAQRPNEAIGAASKGLELDPTKSSAKMNLAHGYLLTDQFEKAKAIYLENKDVKLPDGRGFVQVVLKDFKDLRAAGVSHPDMKRIERLVTGKSSAKRRN